MFKIFGHGADQPLIVPTDKIVPLRHYDKDHYTILHTTFLFDVALDASKLRDSLEILIEKDGWRKLGARLRRNPTTGQLEHHIPAKFSADRPALTFFHIEHHVPKADHSLASRLPAMKTRPTIMADPRDFEVLWHHPNIPTKPSHYLQRDVPQLSLVVVSFSDATLVTLIWHHSLFDALGMGLVLQAWSMVLQGRSAEVPKPYEDKDDPLADLGGHATEPHSLEGVQLSWLGLIYLSFRILFELLFRKPQYRMVCVPAPFLRKLRGEALRELADEIQDIEKPFLSDGDVLCAWLTRANVAHLPSGSNRLVQLCNVLGWRESLAEDVLPSNRPYISNACGLTSVLLPLKHISSKSLGYLAWQVRRSIIDSRRREQVEAFAAMWRKKSALPVFGSPTMYQIGYTNWSKAKLCQLDFSPAADRGGADVLPNALVRPSYVQTFSHNHLPATNLFVILGADDHGNYWLTGYTNSAHWASIEEAISKGEDI